MRPGQRFLVLVIGGTLLFGCRSGIPKSVTPSARTKDANKEHIRGTSDVLRTYRYGESPQRGRRDK